MTATPSAESKTVRSSTTWWICALLVVAIGLANGPLVFAEFTSFDDSFYVWQNPPVLGGLTWPGVVWAFTSFYDGNWHPLTWLSHMLDVQMFGLNAGWHHVTSVLFHAANTVLLFLWLKRLTGLLWRSAIVAALFGLHPLHVESVAWVAERKDVLSAFFFLLALMAYTRYVQKLGAGHEKAKSGKRKAENESQPSSIIHHPSSSYWLSLVWFALGLMSKPMVVTLPFVLLLLDYWPLQRFQVSGFRLQVWIRLIVEKIPFFAFSAGSCVITLLAQRSGSAVMPVKFLPVEGRLQDTVVAYADYLGKLLWPDSLAAYYPLHFPIGVAEWAGAVFMLVLFTGGALFYWRQRPYLAMGWLWYLGMLVPVIGLIQVGSQAMADRYTYLPLIGLFIALVWFLAEISAKWRYRRPVLAILSVGVLAACWDLTAAQVGYWQNSETVARHALAVTGENAMMQGLLGSALFEQGKPEQASEHFAEAARLWPDNVTAQCDLALALVAQGKLDEAVAACQTGLIYKPHSFQLHELLASTLSRQGKLQEAIEEYKTTLQLNPDQLVDLNNLAWLLATAPEASVRDGAEAVRRAEQACQLTHYQRPLFMGTLAAAYAEAGRFDEAIAMARKAITQATAMNNEVLAKKNRELLELYQHRKAYCQPTQLP